MSKSILIVEDSPTHRHLISTPLTRQGYLISTATNGEEALEKAAREMPDLIVLDIVLPLQNGFQVCRQLKTAANTKDIKILMLSSKNRDSDRFWGLRQGADEYMTKPFDENELVQMVARLI